MEKEFGIGVEDFETLITSNFYYVDKTAFIRPLIESGSYVHLITRPRRFGKSLFMDTLRTFLELNPEAPEDISRQQKLFRGLNISLEKDFCANFMGRVPVISLSFKGVDRNNFTSAYKVLARRLVQAAKPYSCLFDSSKLDTDEKETLKNFCSVRFMEDPENQEDAVEIIGKLALFLAKHYGRQVVLLVDEYDVPLAKAAANGYYDDMAEVIKALLEPLKSGGLEKVNGLPAIRKAVLTGCLRVSKESIFTGLNNPDINTVCSLSETYASAIGFTVSEVNAILRYYGLESREDIVRTWYDGYRFATQEIYCPWDVTNFCKDALQSANPLTFQPRDYWLGTSENAILDEFIGFMNSHETEMMQKLLDGEKIQTELNEQLTYADLAMHRPEDFWTLLLFSGYLTLSETDNDRQLYSIKIPNREIRHAFENRIQSRFSARNSNFVLAGEEIARNAMTGNALKMKETLLRVLKKYVSVRDSATRAAAENYYHGFLNALLSTAEASGFIDHYGSNVEAGDGYADFLFTSANEEIGVVIEIKHCGQNEKIRTSQEALSQIRKKRYAEGLLDYGCVSYFGVGIAFAGRTCAVATEKLELSND